MDSSEILFLASTLIGIPWNEKENKSQVLISWAFTLLVQNLWSSAGFVF